MLDARNALLSVKDLQAWYGESHILHGAAFDVYEGEVVTLSKRMAHAVSVTSPEHVKLIAAAVTLYTITLSSPLAVFLQASVHFVTTINVNISLGISQLVTLARAIVRARPRFKHLRAWEIKTELEASKTTAALEAWENKTELNASKPDAVLEASTIKPNLKVEP